ncbi:hypothetical protein [Bordetella sp. BOR01]|uniref:hypothetical protein n=1 Tax=Bordetella sp. BOR01 TaxID=2854779 RepID=UPI001C45C927|nr:hypothetical protein [Bordetella sp. BOR01]MBV7484752.1 hypothetical protein [Bordetella sp. BOR01]
MSAADPVPAIAEADATGELAALYDDIRKTLDVPFVNLVWRHLATIAGALPWTWATVRPLYALPAFDQAADTLARVPVLDAEIEPCLPEALQLVGVGTAECQAVGAMLADYGHANARALLALLAAGARLAGPGGRAAPLPPALGGLAPARARVPGAALPLPGLDTLSPAMRCVIETLNGYGRIADTAIVGSLYRHLAHWPGFLALACTMLARPQRDGVLAAQVRRTLADAQAVARHLPAIGPATLAPAARTAAVAAIDAFTGQAISRMVVMGAAMQRLLPPGGAAPARRRPARLIIPPGAASTRENARFQ